MKIMHVVWGMSTGGIENMLADLTRLQAQSHTVSLIVVNDLFSEDVMQRLSPKVRAYCCGRRVGSFNPLPIARLNRFILRFKPDVIHYHDAAIRKYVFVPNVPTIATVHNTGLPATGYNRCDAIVAISYSVQKELSEFSHVYLIENGINIDSVQVRTSPPTEIRRIVQVGRLYHQQKGQDLLLKALSLLPDDIHADFIGEGASREYLERLALEYGLQHRVRFLGNRDRTYIYSHLCRYDLFVQPSHYEGFGLTVVEAMAAGIPVLVSNIEGPMEIIRDGNYGNYFKSGDANDLAQRIRSASAFKDSREYVRRHYSIVETANKYQTLYKSIKQKKR